MKFLVLFAALLLLACEGSSGGGGGLFGINLSGERCRHVATAKPLTDVRDASGASVELVPFTSPLLELAQDQGIDVDPYCAVPIAALDDVELGSNYRIDIDPSEWVGCTFHSVQDSPILRWDYKLPYASSEDCMAAKTSRYEHMEPENWAYPSAWHRGLPSVKLHYFERTAQAVYGRGGDYKVSRIEAISNLSGDPELLFLPPSYVEGGTWDADAGVNPPQGWPAFRLTEPERGFYSLPDSFRWY